MTEAPHDSAHSRRDDEKLRLHQLVARELERDPQRVLSIARENLRRWLASADGVPNYLEWMEILRTQTPDQVAESIVSDSEEGRRLRQSTPFVGVISCKERDAVLGTRPSHDRSNGI